MPALTGSSWEPCERDHPARRTRWKGYDPRLCRHLEEWQESLRHPNGAKGICLESFDQLVARDRQDIQVFVRVNRGIVDEDVEMLLSFAKSFRRHLDA